ncbi:MAG: GGDEF domain-containing protein [Gammaproteobacteria bacterium]|nr:GGDEF domain-containing protein [Gammaproteobacteria bacterium]
MRIIKSLVPVLILLVAAVYAYQQYSLLPDIIEQVLVIVPLLLAVTSFASSFHFNRSVLFFYALVITLANVVLEMGLITTTLSYATLSVVILLQLLIISLLPERGIISLRAIPVHLSFALLIGLTAYVVMTQAPWAAQVLLSDWLPARYFDWTRLAPAVVIIFSGVFLIMLILSLLKPSPQTSAGLGIVTMSIIQMHVGYSSSSVNVFSSAALLMCLYAVTQESWRMAYLDELTGLPGRRALREKFEQLSGMYTVAMLDVDHFKKFNDTFGHDCGDTVLQMIAARLRKVSGGGIPYRYGGEEFSILFRNIDVIEAKVHLDVLREQIASTPFVVNRGSRRRSDRKTSAKKKKSVKVTVSIGAVDSHANNVASPWDALKRADQALYRAKHKGRNCVCV